MAQTRPTATATEPVIIRGTGNTARFMPGRTGRNADDKQIGFGGLRYSRQAMKNETGFIAGIGIGPGQHKPKGAEGLGFELNAGGKVIAALPNAKLETVRVRDLVLKDEPHPRQYVDWTTFQRIGDQLFRVVPCEEDQTFYWEVWSGDFYESERAYQLLQAGVFKHGSVAYFGTNAGELVINAPAVNRLDPKQGGFSEGRHVRQSQAELMKEEKGTVVAGVPLWIARVWKCRYSAKDCETILVRQYNRFFLLTVKNGKGAYIEVPESANATYESRFERMMIDQKLIDMSAAA